MRAACPAHVILAMFISLVTVRFSYTLRIYRQSIIHTSLHSLTLPADKQHVNCRRRSLSLIVRNGVNRTPRVVLHLSGRPQRTTLSPSQCRQIRSNAWLKNYFRFRSSSTTAPVTEPLTAHSQCQYFTAVTVSSSTRTSVVKTIN
jgi:hypothetical protein